eukprot:1074319-Pelagomonas_calceolata.AAC.5
MSTVTVLRWLPSAVGVAAEKEVGFTPTNPYMRTGTVRNCKEARHNYLCAILTQSNSPLIIDIEFAQQLVG